MVSCWARSLKEGMPDNNTWLMSQLKLTREQLSKKSDFCDQLATRVQELEDDIQRRGSTVRQVRGLLDSTTCELRAAAQARRQAEARHAEAEAALAQVRPVEDSEATALQAAAAAAEARGTAEAQAEVARLLEVAQEASEREAALQDALRKEREQHEEAVRRLEAQKREHLDKRRELNEELEQLSAGLEQKEEDIFSIKFDMVELQNRIQDQASLVSENADAFQKASEELADKDEKLSFAMQKQEELLTQMNESSSKLQEKVEKLSGELEGSRADYKSLDEQMRGVVHQLESDRDLLAAELAQVRSELAARLEAASVGRSTSGAELAEALRVASAATATTGAAEMAEALRLERARNYSLERQLRDTKASDGEALREARRRSDELQEQVARVTAQLATSETQVKDQQAALTSSKLLERQAKEKAEEYKSQVALHTQLSTKQDFSAAAPPTDGSGHTDGTTSLPLSICANEAVPEGKNMEAHPESPFNRIPSVPSVLVAVDLDLGCSKSATLSIAPWQTRADFDDVVQAFLEEHRVRPVFASALVRYLEEVEAQAITFPAQVSANIADLYSRYG